MSFNRKRPLQEVDKFDSIHQPILNATIHAAVTSLSPVKKSVYFDGILTDGTSHLCMVGFSPDQQRQLTNYFDNKQSTQLINCEIKLAREGDMMEVMLKKFTEITRSSKSIKIPEQVPDIPNVIELNELPKIFDFQRVSVYIKVISITKPLTVTGGKTKQDIIISDATATSRLTLWEEQVNTLNENNSYYLSNMVVRQYKSQKYLSMAKIGSNLPVTLVQLQNPVTVKTTNNMNLQMQLSLVSYN